MGLLFYLRCDRTDEMSNWLGPPWECRIPCLCTGLWEKRADLKHSLTLVKVALMESSVQIETYLLVEALEPSQNLIFLRWDSDFQSFHFSLLAFLLLPSNLFLGLGYITNNVNLYKQLIAIL